MMFSYVRGSSVVIVLFMVVVCASCKEDSNKRILLSDPDYIQQLITHLQGEVHTLQATVQTQSGELQTLKTTVQTQHDELQTQSAELQSINAKDLAESGELQTLKTTVQAQTGEISSLKQQLSLANKAVSGSTFVRWGRSDCPSNVTELVYSGYAGGSWYNDKGAAAEYVCLPLDPEWVLTNPLPGDDTGRIYGAEYESSNGHTLFGPQSQDEEVPCAVCRPRSFTSSVMIPARTTCYSGWTQAYSGSLASGYYGYSATQYVCVDGNPQPLPGGGDTNDNGRLFYGVKAFCGSLRCPPYKQNIFMSCVVCMK